MRATILKKLIPAAALALAFQASTAMAFFDAELTVGKRWYSIDNDGTKTGVQSQEVQVAAHLDPIPLVPVSFGALIGMGTLNNKDMGSDVSSAAVFETSLDIQAWVPMVPIVTPFARLTIPVYGTMATKGSSKDTTTGKDIPFVFTDKLSGYHLSAGVKYGLIPLLKLTLEVGIGSETAKPDEYKADGVKLPNSDFKSSKVASNSAALGLEVGF